MSPAIARSPTARHSQVHEEALRAFVAKVERDTTIVAVILYGSLAYDDVWEKSDIDIMVVTEEERAASKGYYLLEGDVNIHADVRRRSEFKKAVEADLGGWMQSILMRSTLLFSRDDSIRAYYENVQHLGRRDRDFQLLRAANGMLGALTKAEKWLAVKGDVEYSFLWIMYTIYDLAKIEVLLHDEAPGREVMAQALRHNPALFGTIYSDFVQQPKDAVRVQAVLDLINSYLDAHLDVIFRPILDFLDEAAGVRTASELNEHFAQQARIENASSACEWLAVKGIIRQVPSPLQLTVKSKVKVNEAAYDYEREAR
ncbi:MAG TPA: nucleotidyltransferase domain-containing protein [Chloroflexota bacterium]|nr:nucleotidyltransferase domain-containing protein [Chloroflexota bacterium]